MSARLEPRCERERQVEMRLEWAASGSGGKGLGDTCDEGVGRSSAAFEVGGIEKHLRVRIDHQHAGVATSDGVGHLLVDLVAIAGAPAGLRDGRGPRRSPSAVAVARG